MSKRILMTAAVILIILLVYGGLWSVEKGIKDIMFLEQPMQALAWQREASGEIAITFAGKTAVINIPEIYSRLEKTWDKLTFIWR